MSDGMTDAERRRSLIGASIMGVLIVAVIGICVVVATAGHGMKKPAAAPTKSASTPVAAQQVIPAAPTGPTTIESPATRVTNATGIDGVMAYDTAGYPGTTGSASEALPHTHVNGPVTYSVLPPIGGDHNGVWMNAGVYTQPVPNERAVHDLEHGAVWITYRPNLSATDVAALQQFVGKQSFINEGSNENRYVVMSPWASNDLPSPIVISSWGYQLYVASPSDARLQQFVDKFRHSATYSPEYGAPADGVPIHSGSGQLGGGNPAMYGSKFANPQSF